MLDPTSIETAEFCRSWDAAIVTNNLFLLEGLKRNLETFENIKLVRSLSSPEEACRLMETLRPDFLIVHHPRQGSLIGRLKTLYPQLHVITLDERDGRADDYLNTDRPLKPQLIELLRRRDHLSVSIRGIPLYHQLVKRTEFSPQELRILTLLSYGHRQEDIAERLQLARNTIDRYLMNLRDKVNARNTIHLLAIALRGGLIQ